MIQEIKQKNIKLYLYNLFILLGAETSGRVGDPNAELLCSLHDKLPLFGRDSVRDLGAVLPVLHHEDLQLTDIVDQDLEN